MKTWSNSAFVPENQISCSLFEAFQLENWVSSGEKYLLQARSERDDSASPIHEWIDPISPYGQERIRYWNEEEGWGVFYSPQIVHPSARTINRKTITGIRVVAYDFDESGPLPSFPIEPTIINETSPGRYQCQWYVTDGLPDDVFEGVQQRLVQDYQCDPAYLSPSQLMRVPGTINWKRKYPEPFRGRVTVSGVRYSRDQIVAAFPPVPPSPRGTTRYGGSGRDIGDTAQSSVLMTGDVSMWLSALGVVLASTDTRSSGEYTRIYRLASMAFCEGFGGSEDAYRAWDEECRKHPGYDEVRNRSGWLGWCRTVGQEDNASLGTLHNMATMLGWRDPRSGPRPSEATDYEPESGLVESPITDRAMVYVRRFFEESGHRPDERFMIGIRNIAIAAESILRGSSTDRLFISSLAAGVGKSTTVIFFIKAALELDPDFSCLIVGDRHEELTRYADQLVEFGVPVEEVARYTGKERSSDDRERACRSRVVLTTKKKIESSYIRTGFDFAEMSEFAYHGKARPLVFWDETYRPVHATSLSDQGLDRVLGEIEKKQYGDLYLELQDFRARIVTDALVATATFPSVDIDREDWIDSFPKHTQSDAALVHDLMGREVRISRHGPSDTAWITYNPVLPPDLPGRMAVLDASGQFLGTYRLLDQHTETVAVRFLRSPEKDYSGLTIHHMERGVGRDRRRDEDNWEEMARIVADTINREVPDGERVLVVSHTGLWGNENLEALVRGGLNEGRTVSFLTYGWHTATNAYRDCSYVFLVGLFIQPASYYEALARGVLGIPLDEEIPDRFTRLVGKGEIKHHTYQAACRGTVRQLRGVSCPENVHLYVMCSGSALKRDELHGLFPGSRMDRWVATLGKREKRAFDRILEHVDGWAFGAVEVLMSKQLASIAECGPTHLRSVITEALQEWLAAEGVGLRESPENRGKWILSKFPAH